MTRLRLTFVDFTDDERGAAVVDVDADSLQFTYNTIRSSHRKEPIATFDCDAQRWILESTDSSWTDFYIDVL